MKVTAPMDTFEAVKSESPHYQEVIRYYKINPCFTIQPQKSQKAKASPATCDQRTCFYYHSFEERRRPAFDEKTTQLLYEPSWCLYLRNNQHCPNGDLCSYAHSQNEIYYHPLFYKTNHCEECYFEVMPKLCPFYHSDEINRSLMLEKFRTKKSRENSMQQGIGEQSMKMGFNLDIFKTKPCSIRGNHNPKVCNYYHFSKDRRRPTNVFSYSPSMCTYAAKNKECPRGDHCQYCHNKVEQLYHPDKYKRKFCLCHPHNLQKCEYGDFCSFAHSETEIKIELLHNLKKDQSFYLYKYKTVFCPYIYDHDRNQCVYAHNPQDFRRDPSQFNYNPVKCPYWTQDQIFSYEEGRCPAQMNCENCHGWKELDYHPANYKTKDCPNYKNCTKVDCPFVHPEKEMKDKNMMQPRNLSMGTGREFEGLSHQKQTFEMDQLSGIFSTFNVKHERKNQSHFAGPIMPQTQMVSPYGLGSEVYNENKGKQRYYMNEGSTRPNSNVSSIFNPEEDTSKGFAKKKKQMSYQSKKENPQDMGKGKVKRISSPQMDFYQNFGGGGEERADEVFEERKDSRKASGTKISDSFESWKSETIERNVPGSDKSGKLNTEAFKKQLISSLQKQGLENVVQAISSATTDFEALKSFSQKEFNMFPQLKVEDKEKMVRIIRKIVEEETSGSNIISSQGADFGSIGQFEAHGDENPWVKQFDFLDSNHGLEFTKHPF